MQFLVFILLSTFLRFNKINIQGAHFFSKGALKKVLSIKKGTTYNLLYLRARERRIIELYKGYGFFDIHLSEGKIEFKKNKVNITLKIIEGKRYKIGKLRILPKEVIEETGVLKHRNLHGFFSYETIGEIEDFIFQHYANSGYPFVNIRDSIIPCKDTHLVDVIIFVNKGGRYIIDDIYIQRNKGIRPYLIKKVITIKKGQYFSRKRILESLREINALGIYEGISYSLKETSDSTLIIIITAKPAPSRFIRIEGGYNIPREFHGTFRIGHDNIFKDAQKLSIQYNFLRTPKHPLQRKSEIYYTEPLFLDQKLSFQLHPFYQRDYELGNELYGIDMSLGKRIASYSILRFFLGWKNLSMGTDVHGISNSAVLTYSTNRTNNFFYPTRGIKYTTKIQQTGGILRGDFSFRRLYVSFAWYYSIEGYVFALYNALMYQRPFGKTNIIPLEEKFRIGGDGTVRGVKRDYVMTDGGILMDIEIRRKFTHWFGVSIFMDNFYVLSGMHDLIQSPGFGIRLYTPAGPLRIDFASPVDNLKNVQINIGIGEMF